MFTCKGCTEVARLVGEVEDLRKMMESLKRMDRDWKKKEEKQGIKMQHWTKRRRRNRRSA